MEPVKFYVKLSKEADPDQVKSELERLAGDISIQLEYDKRLNWFKGTADQHNYEGLFSARLEYMSEVLEKTNKEKLLTYRWVERKPAEIPEDLKNKINEICINNPVHLTD